MKSCIVMSEEVANKERKFGSWQSYFPAKIVLEEGKEIEALFTMGQLQTAMERAARNPEDMPAESFWGWLFD